jgi:hypothetical protein
MLNTRNQVMSEYTVTDGIIRDPGKFEAEPVYAPVYYDALLDGCGEDLAFMEDGCGEYAALVPVGDPDRIEFPELGSARYVLVSEGDTGFVSIQLIETEAEADRLREACASKDE